MDRRGFLLKAVSLSALSLLPFGTSPAFAQVSSDAETLPRLSDISGALPLNSLSIDQVKELQTALNRLGYQSGPIDGFVGVQTRAAWGEFKDDVFQTNPDLIGPGSIGILKEKLDELGTGRIHDFSTKEGTIEAIKFECQSMGIGLKTQIAYVLATVQHETANTFQPVREAFWLSENWRRNNLRYYPYYGRGYVQLTWEFNYRRYSEILGTDLVSNPDLAMDPNVALFILVHGCRTGTFTGRKITDYINNSKTDFVQARRVINGTDRQFEIARLAERYLSTL